MWLQVVQEVLSSPAVAPWVQRLAPELHLKLCELKPKDAVALLKLWRSIACRSGRVVAYNDVSTSVLRCNTSPCLLGAEAAARAALFYVVKYVTKDSTAPQASLTVLAAANKHIEQFPSSASDSGTRSRVAKHFCQRALNSLNMELSDTMAASCVLGFKAHKCSDTFVNVPMQSALQAARVLAAGGDILVQADAVDGEHADEEDFDIEAPRKERDEARVHVEADDAFDIHVLGWDDCPAQAESFADVNGRVRALPQSLHYLYRGHRLSRFNFVEYCVCFKIEPIAEMNPNHRRPANARCLNAPF